jgi:hypothetical protein
MPCFKLRKWYFDCVTPEGRGIILYAARLCWGFLRLNYTARIEFSANDPSHAYSHSLRKFADPVITPEKIELRVPSLNVSATWRAGSPAISEQLLSTSDGSINWTCLSPSARAEVDLNGENYEGMGYTELIELSLPPRSLGIEELWWGRFISEEVSLVWIIWKGTNARKFIYLNGELIDATVNETGLFSPLGTLRFINPQTLRNDSIGRSLRIPFLQSVLKRLRIDLDEHKYLSKANWTESNNSSDGWAIYEVVRWPK